MNPPYPHSYSEAGNRGLINKMIKTDFINPLFHLFPRLMPGKD